jgi:hypothetical protein
MSRIASCTQASRMHADTRRTTRWCGVCAAALLATGAPTAVRAADAGAAGSSDVDKECPSFFDRLYMKYFGLACVSTASSVVRGQGVVKSGNALVELTPDTGTERTLWACTRCWSPVRFHDGVAVATPTGIVVVGTSDAHPLVTISNVARILGASRDSPDALVVVVESGADAGAEVSIRVVDTSRGTVTAAGDHIDPGTLPRLVPDQIRDDRSILEEGGQAGHAPLVRRADGSKRSVSPALDRKQDLFFRFSPIWLPHGKVAYVREDL